MAVNNDDVYTNPATITPVISGSGNLVKTGPGTLVLSTAANSYTGITVISGGVLSLQAATLAAAGHSAPVVQFDPATRPAYALNGTNVSQLTNLSGGTAGNATTLTNANGLTAPTLTVSNSAFNGQSTLNFNGEPGPERI